MVENVYLVKVIKMMHIYIRVYSSKNVQLLSNVLRKRLQ